MNHIGIQEALDALTPQASWCLRGNEYSGLIWQDESQTKPTEDAINAKITELKSALPMKLLRIEIDFLIAQSDWRVTKAKETGTNIPAAWKTYRQALRDLPASSTPTLDSNNDLDMSSVTWPTEPS